MPPFFVLYPLLLLTCADPFLTQKLETDDVKSLYEMKAMEENKRGIQDDTPAKVLDVIESLNDAPKDISSNRSLNLESAIQFASLVAAYHVDTSTRDCLHIDIGPLLDRALLVTTSEI